VRCARLLFAPLLSNGVSNLLLQTEHYVTGGKMTRSETEAQYRIGRRIEAEERALDHASVIFTSTVQEVCWTETVHATELCR
jgi:sucrose-phosphate synthase